METCLFGRLKRARRRAKLGLPNYEPFTPKVLKELRLEARLTQAELAEQVGIPLPTLRDMEYGKTNPTAKNISKLGQYFSIRFYIPWPGQED